MSEINTIKAQYLSLSGAQCARRSAEAFESGSTHTITPDAKYGPVSFTMIKIGNRVSDMPLFNDTSLCSGIWRVTSTAKVLGKSYSLIEEFDSSNYCYRGAGSIVVEIYTTDQKYLLRRPLLKCR